MRHDLLLKCLILLNQYLEVLKQEFFTMFRYTHERLATLVFRGFYLLLPIKQKKSAIKRIRQISLTYFEVKVFFKA